MTVEPGRRRFTVELEPAEVALLELIAGDTESPERTIHHLVKGALRTYLTALDPATFEQVVGRALTACGFTVNHLGGAGDQGIDLLARSKAQTIAIQCKRYSDQSITPQQMREFLGAITAAKATTGIFVTTSTYTAAAREFGVTQGIELVDASNLKEWLTGLLKASRQALLCGNPNCRHEPKGVSPWTHVWVCSKCGQTNSVTPA